MLLIRSNMVRHGARALCARSRHAIRVSQTRSHSVSLLSASYLEDTKDEVYAHRYLDQYYKWLVYELRSDHAGETGAVFIYRGALAALRIRPSASEQSVQFAQSHMEAESMHLRYMDAVLNQQDHSMFLPLWRASGFALGFFPTLVGGDRWLYLTVDAVETFVDEHYSEYIDMLRSDTWGDAEGRCSKAPKLLKLLEYCRDDELHHRDDARTRHSEGNVSQSLEAGVLERSWAAIVDCGSRAAVALARWK